MALRGKPKAEARKEDRRAEPAAPAADSGTALVALARGLAEVATEHNLSELILDTKDITLTVRRGPIASPAAAFAPAAMPAYAAVQIAAPGPAAAAAEPAADKDKHHVVTSPFVGTFYRRPNPDAQNYVAVHDKIDKGQVLCIVEAMKLMNEIEADVGGTIAAILVDDGAPVEYGQPLFKIAV
jgi:acetyl-CoA carboxylase biotin carboxyl carrier protein